MVYSTETNSIDSGTYGVLLFWQVFFSFSHCHFYYFIPERKYTFRQVLPRHLCRTNLLADFFHRFCLLRGKYGHHSVVYGSIGAVIVLLLWLHFSAVTLILGAEFNNILAEHRQKHS